MTPSIELAHPSAENALLAAFINERLAPATAMSLGLVRQDFAYEINALIYDAVVRLVTRGSQVDRALLEAELSSHNTLDAIGGEAVIAQIAASPYEPGSVGSYVSVIRDRSMRRRLQSGFERCTRMLYSQPDGKVLLEETQVEIYRTLDDYMSSAFSGLRGTDLVAAWEARHASGPRIGYSYRTPQAVLGGRARGDLSIWGLYTSDGKSTIALRNVVHACRAGLKVGFALLEMTDEQIMARLYSYLTGIDMGRIERDELSLEDRELMDTAAAEICRWDLYVYCDPSITVSDIRAIQMQERFDLWVIDYLQRFDFTDFKEIPRLAKQLKNVALTTKCHVDLFSQLTPQGLDNRNQNPFSKPNVNSLYGGKATAHEADNIIYLWAHRARDEDGGWQRTGTGEMYFEKVRQGRPGLNVRMQFNPNTIQWEEA